VLIHIWSGPATSEPMDNGDHWLHLIGKGGLPGKVASSPLVRGARAYLAQRRLPVPLRAGRRRRRFLRGSKRTGSRASQARVSGPWCGASLRRYLIGTDHPFAAEQLRCREINQLVREWQSAN